MGGSNLQILCHEVKGRHDEDNVGNQTTSGKGGFFILQKERHGTYWSIRLLPFSGFVSSDVEPAPGNVDGLITYKMKSLSCTYFKARNK